MPAATALAGQRITAAWLNQNIPGTWQAGSPRSGWTNHGGTSVTFQCRQFNSVTLEVIGILSGGTTGNTVAGETFASIPTSLPLPVTTQTGTGVILAGTGVGSAFTISVQTNGYLQFLTAVSGATEIGFHFFISLDA